MPAGAADNMALDEKIFNRYIEEGIPVLRLYGWEKPSITYGISQRPQVGQVDLEKCNRDGIQIAQRITGGGLLFHNREITYSLACSKEDIGEEKEVFVSYRRICAFLINFYKSLGLKACFALEADDFNNKSLPHQLCSASHEKYDIVIGGRKIGGNAQKRRRGVIFQHGSIPLSIDWSFLRRYLPGLPDNISSSATTLDEELTALPEKQVLEQKLIDAFAHVYGVSFEEGDRHLARKVSVPFPKPAWLNKKISLRDCSQVKSMLKDLGLHTVCEEALCPNMGECFSRRQATFMILGAICTRGCLFCGVAKGKPLAPDADEPRRIAEAVRKLGLTHVVVTSVTRDDLPDGGAGAFEKTILALRSIGGGISIETLIPDFNADLKSLRVIADASPDIIAHNIETVPSLYKEVRPTGASYQRSLEVLSSLKNIVKGDSDLLRKRLLPPKLKSGLMLGLGEKRDEVLAVFDDLVEAGCVFLSIGQYLAPSAKHFPVREYLHPRVFEEYKKEALKRGFSSVMSGPYVRSSYAASEYGL